MESPNSTSSTTPAFKPFTKAERIQQLNDIDKSITTLLRSAGLALKTLSSAQSSPEEPKASTLDRRAAFEATCNQYLTTLQAVDIGLHRQIYGLEEAGIVPADVAKPVVKEPSRLGMLGAMSKALDEREGQRKEGGESGMGGLDIGFLNSQSGKVGRDMEAELWGKARVFLEKVDGKEAEGDGKQDDDHDMNT